jgi:glycosyltransferase involved in cell wall biosynthesis
MDLSIITINKNNAAGLEKTIQSVAGQTFTNFEYIIIDGASDDDSVELIKKFANKINYWESKPDTGIYNAINKGINKAQGEFCLFLNSGDCLLEPATLEKVFIELDNKSDIYYSNLRKNNGSYTKIPEKVGISYLISGTMNHQNMLIRRQLFIQHGFYNEDFRILADTEFYLKEFWKYNSKFSHLHTDISLYDANGLSTKHSATLMNIERKILFNNVFGDLGEAIFDLYEYRVSLYGQIINSYGYSKLLFIWLRLYRFIAHRFFRNKRQIAL